MADRKVLGKYYPPDFDPEKLAQKGRIYRSYGGKRGKGGEKLMNVRFMFPFTMCCDSCNEFIYVGTKFNSRVENVKNEEYLGTPIWRFYARCPHCRGSITFKTDPEHTEYVLESGGVRTYDPRKDADLAKITIQEQLEEEMIDSVRALEHKTYNTAKELHALEQLDELRRINKRLLNREAIVDNAVDCLKKKILLDSMPKDEELTDVDIEDLRLAKEEMSKTKFESILPEFQSEKNILPESSKSSETDSKIKEHLFKPSTQAHLSIRKNKQPLVNNKVEIDNAKQNQLHSLLGTDYDSSDTSS